MENKEMMFLHAFIGTAGVGAVSLRAVKEHFESYEEAWKARDGEYMGVAGLPTKGRNALLVHRKARQPEKEFEKLLRSGVWIISDGDETYPEILRQIPNAPVALYGRGSLEQLGTSIGVVGTRRPTRYGIEAAQAFVSSLGNVGITVASGLAIGIDTIAHESALKASARTIAVLGSAVDEPSLFPSENCRLAARIADAGGAVISEYPPGTLATKGYFPQRNRIISGMSRGVLVVEAREKSGALITARFALEQNREVFAVPGSIFSSTSRGPNRLIQEGAKAVCSAEDLLEELGMEYTKEILTGVSARLSEKEQLLLASLDQPMSIDEIKQTINLDTSIIIGIISMLELKSLVRNMGQDTYQKI